MWRGEAHRFGEALSSNGRVSPVRIMKPTCAGLTMATSLSWIKFLHCTDPGREKERINVTFRWIKHFVHSCPLFQARVACCLPTCAQGSSVSVSGCGKWRCLGFLTSPWCLVHLGSASLASLHPCVYRAWVTQVFLLLDTPFGRRSVGALPL